MGQNAWLAVGSGPCPPDTKKPKALIYGLRFRVLLHGSCWNRAPPGAVADDTGFYPDEESWNSNLWFQLSCSIARQLLEPGTARGGS